MTQTAENQAASSSNKGMTQTAGLPVPNPAYSIEAKRLAGSPACLNCGTELAGPFCHFCGQPDKNFMRFFPVLIREMLSDFLDFDSRFTRTMKPLLFHPGKLTRDYLDGRRFRYTPPLRLYIFASMAFFLIAAALAGSAIVFDTNNDSESGGVISENISQQVSTGLDAAVREGEMTAEEAAELRALILSKSAIKPVDSDTELTGESESDPDTEPSGSKGLTITAGPDDDVININGKPWDRETNPFTVPLVPDFINNWINDEIEESPKKGREIEANPDIIVDKMFDVLPIAVFIMLPLVALLLKFWYLFSGHYYIEHLIHALHNHAFLFVIFILVILADTIGEWLFPGEGTIYNTAAQVLSVVVTIWVPLYLFISLKKVYRQGWIFTFLKFSLIGISYLFLLVAVTSAAALASFVLL